MRIVNLSLVLAVVSVLSCSSVAPSDLLVLFRVNGLTPAVKSVGVTLRLDGKLSKEGDFLITDNLNQFGVRLPASTVGTLSAIVSGRDSLGQAILGESSPALVTIQPGATTVNITAQLKDLYPCTVDHWCPYGPLFTGARLASIWGFDRDDIWVGGSSGTLFHFNGQFWTAATMPTTYASASIYSIWGSSPSDVYVVTNISPMLHWDGTALNPLNAGSTDMSGLLVVGGSGENDVWSGGIGEKVIHWDGTTWNVIQNPNSPSNQQLRSIWSRSFNEAWIVGNQNVNKILRCTNSGCNDIRPSQVSKPMNIWGTSPSNIWIGTAAVGTTPSSFWNSSDAENWNNYPSNSALNFFSGIWGYNSNDIWAVGNNTYGSTFVHWEGNAWREVTSGTSNQLFSIWGSAPSTSENAIWAVGEYGTDLKWQDGHWVSAIPASSAIENLLDAWGSGPNDIWAVGQGGIIHWNGIQWSSVLANTSLNGIWGIDASHVWAAGANGTILSWDGLNWNSIVTGTTNYLYDVWAFATNNVWVVGGGGMTLHYDGSKWTQISAGTPDDLVGVWGSGPSDVWAVSNKGSIMHLDNSGTWSLGAALLVPFQGIWGSGAADVWLVGTDPAQAGQGIFYRCPSGPTSCAVPPNRPLLNTYLSHVWGSDPNHIWLTGGNGTILYWDGKNYSTQISGTHQGLTSIWGSGTNDIWAVGTAGTILRH